eukprot:CAMPEP_0172484400 /NCGR_PEP_ID=MMETSP1066-20121228/11870_1 /TAXON_ID=671091 /ORGANISM="Coscinodiscus wailesii, Strain CCMP2513" /LENGTH=216 /DNA_ID=CAMNT_0013248909 /DNA_START=100 /DNA_END=747 /DNA_ORIENTATION=+
MNNTPTIMKRQWRIRPILLILLFPLHLLLLLTVPVPTTGTPTAATPPSPPDGQQSYDIGLSLFKAEKYNAAAKNLWKSIIHYPSSSPDVKYTIQQSFQSFLNCYARQNRLGDGYAYIASQYYQQGSAKEAREFSERALEVDPDNNGAKEVLQKLGVLKVESRTAEMVYDLANGYFNKDEYKKSAELFEESCQLSNGRLFLACANAVFCRSRICEWG